MRSVASLSRPQSSALMIKAPALGWTAEERTGLCAGSAFNLVILLLGLGVSGANLDLVSGFILATPTLPFQARSVGCCKAGAAELLLQGKNFLSRCICSLRWKATNSGDTFFSSLRNHAQR